MHVTYAPDKPRLVWLQEKPEDPQFEPHVGIKMVQVLGSLVYIYENNTKTTAFTLSVNVKLGMTIIFY